MEGSQGDTRSTGQTGPRLGGAGEEASQGNVPEIGKIKKNLYTCTLYSVHEIQVSDVLFTLSAGIVTEN